MSLESTGHSGHKPTEFLVMGFSYVLRILSMPERSIFSHVRLKPMICLVVRIVACGGRKLLADIQTLYTHRTNPEGF